MSSRRAPRLQIVVVGKVRPPYDAAARDYEKRIADRVPLVVAEVAAEPLHHGDDQVLRREGDRVRARTLPEAWKVALDPAGRAPASSQAFATWLGRRLEDPRPTSFIVGGAMGLPRDLVAEVDETLSLGPLTLPHQLARVVLGEQIYRAMAALAGHPYAH
jgi:23S rRNA (pseudouridine1915-N3)-methyltransferase